VWLLQFLGIHLNYNLHDQSFQQDVSLQPDIRIFYISTVLVAT
jgi:hypothetical protein